MTARGGNVIGNSLKTIFTRIQRPRVIRDLEKIGVAVKDLDGVMLPTMEILKNMAVEFDNLGKSQKAQAAEMVGGVFQVNILKAVLSDLNKEYSVYNQALKASTSATDEAEKRIQELTKTFAGLLNQTQANVTQLGATMANLTLEPVARKVLTSFNKAFEKGQKSESIGKDIGKGMLKGLGTFLSGPGLAIGAVAFVKLFSKLTMFAKDAFQSIMGLNKAQQQQAQTQKQIYEIMRKNPDIIKQIQTGELSVAKAHDAILDKILAENLALQAQQKIIGALGQSSAIGMAGSVTRRAQGKLGKSIGETSSHGFNSGSAKELFGMMEGGYSKKALADPGIKKTSLSDGKKTINSFVNKHENKYSFTNSEGKKVDMVVPEKGSKAYYKFMENATSSARGFIPNFAPRKGMYYDFDETLGTYGKNVKSKDLFGADSARLAKPTPLAQALKGKTLKVLTARDVKATEPIATKLKSWGIEVEKILTTANMFRDLKISSDGSGKIVRNPSRTGRMKGYRNLQPAEKKALLLQRMQKKFGWKYGLTDDAQANIEAIKALKNPNIAAELYSFKGQHAGRGSGNAEGFVPNFAGWHGIAPIERHGGKARPDVRAGTKGPLGENLTFDSPIVKKLIKQNVDKGIPLPRAIQAAAQQIKTSKQGFLSIREQKRILEGIKSGNLNLAGGFIPNFARGQGTRHGTVGIKEFSAMRKQDQLDWISGAESKSYLRNIIDKMLKRFFRIMEH